MKKLFGFVLFGLSLFLIYNNFIYAQDCDGIKLNTEVPFVTDGSRCIEIKDSGKVFPKLMGGLSKLIINAILIISFIFLVAGGLFMSFGGFYQNSYALGKKLIFKVIVGIILLGTSGIILYLINPNFFVPE